MGQANLAACQSRALMFPGQGSEYVKMLSGVKDALGDSGQLNSSRA